MFCDLKGTTLRPVLAKIRQRAAAMRLLPTDEAVPCTMMALATTGGEVHWLLRENERDDHLHYSTPSE
jgi:hypothetical protein